MRSNDIYGKVDKENNKLCWERSHEIIYAVLSGKDVYRAVAAHVFNLKYDDCSFEHTSVIYDIYESGKPDLDDEAASKVMTDIKNAFPFVTRSAKCDEWYTLAESTRDACTFVRNLIGYCLHVKDLSYITSQGDD